MLVEQVMQTGVVTITPKTSLPEALELVRQRGIRHLPVVENGALVGIVSDRDLKRAMASSATTLGRHELQYLLDRLTAAEIMTSAVITTGRMLPIEDAARLMVKEKISALPVTEAGCLIGIVTETDVLDLFVRGMGAGEPSSRIEVRVAKDGPGLAELVHAVEEAHVEIASIMTLSDRSDHKDIVIRVRSMDPRAAVARLRARGYDVRGPKKG